jgi:hypothetical protein
MMMAVAFLAAVAATLAVVALADLAAAAVAVAAQAEAGNQSATIILSDKKIQFYNIK